MSGARCRMVGCPHRCPRVPSRALLSRSVVGTFVGTLPVAGRGCVRPPAGARRPLSHRLRAVSRQIVMRQVVERGGASRDSRIAGAGEQRLWAVAKSPCTRISEVNRREHRSVHESAPWRGWPSRCREAHTYRCPSVVRSGVLLAKPCHASVSPTRGHHAASLQPRLPTHEGVNGSEHELLCGPQAAGKLTAHSCRPDRVGQAGWVEESSLHFRLSGHNRDKGPRS